MWGLLKTKTFWVNVVGGTLQVINHELGGIIPEEVTIALQVLVNICVRIVTRKPVWEK